MRLIFKLTAWGLAFLGAAGLSAQAPVEPDACTSGTKSGSPNPDAILYMSNHFAADSANRGSNFNAHLIRINIHHVLRSDGTGNFTETGDGQGNPYNGYDYAHALTKYLNWAIRPSYAWESPPRPTSLNLRPYNLPYNQAQDSLAPFYRFVLDGVYFHRNNDLFAFANGGSNGGLYRPFRFRRDSVLNVFLTNDTSILLQRGYAMNTRNGIIDKYTVCNRIYDSYNAYVNGTDLSEDAFYTAHSGAGYTLHHEIAHLLGLDHTVRVSTGGNCSVQPNSTCGDACTDTWSAYEAWVHSLTWNNNVGVHPACGWNAGRNPGCSNNLMDYTNDHALSMQQLRIMEHFLNTGMSSFTACKGVGQDKTVCSMGYPVVAEFGRQVFIRPCSPATTLEVSGSAKLETYFSQSVDLGAGFSVGGGTEWSVRYYPACP